MVAEDPGEIKYGDVGGLTNQIRDLWYEKFRKIFENNANLLNIIKSPTIILYILT